MLVEIRGFDIVLKCRVGDRWNAAMLMGGCFYTIEHLQKILPMYEERLCR